MHIVRYNPLGSKICCAFSIITSSAVALYLHSDLLLLDFLRLTGATNSPVQSRRELRIATAIFPTLSLLNHSCCPSTSLAFSTGAAVDPSGSSLSAELSESVSEPGVTVTVRAARVIDAGQEILHCYGKKMILSMCMKRNHFRFGITDAKENPLSGLMLILKRHYITPLSAEMITSLLTVSCVAL